jgi:hypothetical protein
MSDYKLQSSKFKKIEVITQAGIASSHSLYGERSLKVDITDAGATNLLLLEGTIDNADTWVPVGYIIGSDTKIFEIGEFSKVRFNVSVYNTTASGIKVSAVSQFNDPRDGLKHYKTIDVDQSNNNVTYIGSSKLHDNWMISRSTVVSKITTIEYANYYNNDTITDYDTAWTNRATLAYTKIYNLEGV